MAASTPRSEANSLRAVWMPAESNFTGSPPQARCGHVTASIRNDSTWGDEFIVIHGGIDKDKDALDSLNVLSLEQGTWTSPRAPVPPEGADGADRDARPHARAFHAGAALGEALYIFGGHIFVKAQARLHTFGDLWRLDTGSWEWTRVEPVDAHQPAPCARDRASLVAAPDGASLLLFGGADGANRRLEDLWRFDTRSAAWTELTCVGPRPRARCSATLCALPNRLILFGGDTYGVSSELWSLNVPGVTSTENVGPDGPRLATWTALTIDGPAPVARRAHAAAAAPSKGLVVFGGWTELRSLIGIKNRGQTLDDVFLLDRRSKSLVWRPASAEEGTLALPCSREKHTLTAVSDGRLFLFGGTDTQTTLADAWWLQVEEWEVCQPRRSPTPTTSPGSDPRRVSFATSPESDPRCATPPTMLPAPSPSPSTSYLPAVPLGLTSAFASLRDRLGLPGSGIPSEILPLGALADAHDPALLTLGRRELGPLSPDADNEHLARTARLFLASCAPQDLRVGDVEALVADYRRLARLGVRQALHAGASPEDLDALPGRFMHLQAQDLRIREVREMLDEYRSLVSGLKHERAA